MKYVVRVIEDDVTTTLTAPSFCFTTIEVVPTCKDPAYTIRARNAAVCLVRIHNTCSYSSQRLENDIACCRPPRYQKSFNMSYD
jgi:hypothetical protein